MKFLALVAVSLLALSLLPARSLNLPAKCDLKTVEAAHYCEVDDLLLETKDIVSNVVYYLCEECEEISRDKGDCFICEEPMVKKTSGKNVCKHCLEKPLACEACLKSYFECPDCGGTSVKEASCPDCEVKLVAMKDRALVEYVCAECFATSLKRGKCADEECDLFGKPMEKTCSSAGSFPHLTTSN